MGSYKTGSVLKTDHTFLLTFLEEIQIEGLKLQ